MTPEQQYREQLERLVEEHIKSNPELELEREASKLQLDEAKREMEHKLAEQKGAYGRFQELVIKAQRRMIDELQAKQLPSSLKGGDEGCTDQTASAMTAQANQLGSKAAEVTKAADSFVYDLRLVLKKDGTYEWQD